MKHPIELEIIMPVYNEEDGIASVILSISQEIGNRIRFRFVISEDGSTDKTRAILQKLSRKVPMILLTESERAGYSQGVLRALRVSRAPFVCCVDSDGQYDPKDIWKLWNARNKSDVVIGNRIMRRDSVFRVVMSRLFYYSFYFLFPKNIHDPSCSYILFRQEVARTLVNVLGLTNEGFWWEFMARVKQYGYSVREQRVSHFARQEGYTKIYSLVHLPKIVIQHVIAMVRVAKSRPA
ncbi:glycosyltransferase family 2 protein [Candidatus Woesebacteria bacterium]|nr:glycosyltransferase family 2 protein [Candidatus Woesebacteria bacterium]